MKGISKRKLAILALGVTAVLILALVVILAGCGGSSTTTTTAAAGGSAQVVLQNIAINPTSVTIKAGGTVTWTNKDGFDHHLVGDKGEFDSGNMAAGATFSFTFKTAGTITYHCSIHPQMTGTIIVQ